VELEAGQIVLVDWRHDPRHPEPNKLRPAVVVQDSGLFDASYPTVIVVPLTRDGELAIQDLTVLLEPTESNGCSTTCYLLPQNISCVSKQRIQTVTASRITPEELQQLRQLIALAVGVFG